MNSSTLPSRNGRAISAIDGKIYVAGGENSIGHSRERSLFQYDISTDKWSKLKDSDLTSYVFEPAYETYNGKFFVIGGQRTGDRSSELLNKVKIFNPKDGQFKNSAYDLPEGRVSAVAAIVEDQLYVIGGRDYSYYMGNFSAKSDYKSVISIPLSDLQITEDEAKPDEDATEEPKDQDGTKSGEETAKGILSITMINGLQKDYLLSIKEINDFLKWYKERSFGIGMNFYEINDEHNKGPFTSKKDYVVYQNILMFDIKQY
ncbi:hypothetical protein M1D85_06260 [Bacillus sp. JZ35]